MGFGKQSSRAGLTHADLIVLLVTIPVLLVVLTACIGGPNREMANRVKCASNLRQIGQAIQLYAGENGKRFPQATYEPGEIVTPVFGTGALAQNPFGPGGPQPNDVTAAMFLLLRTQEIGSEVFICPSTSGTKDDFGGNGNTAANRSNFSDYKKNCYYSITNPYPDSAAVAAGYNLDTTLGPEFVVAADRNPGTKAKGSTLTVLTTTSTPMQMRMGNSNNHSRDGQNVLCGDGHVVFHNNPLVGVLRDNIYANKKAQVIASPVDQDDSVLLPTDD